MFSSVPVSYFRRGDDLCGLDIHNIPSSEFHAEDAQVGIKLYNLRHNLQRFDPEMKIRYILPPTCKVGTSYLPVYLEGMHTFFYVE